MGGSVGGNPRRIWNMGVKEYTKDAFRIAGIYAAASSLWILISDGALVLIAKDQQTRWPDSPCTRAGVLSS